MCGISGIVNFKVTEPVDQYLVERMAQTQLHRGPDDYGYFVEGSVGLGHRRLSIIDLSGGKQPMFNEDGSVVVVFNGEVYNFADLSADLAARGHIFKTRSDTEAIVHSYEEYGDECVHGFRGMFAFAIWDRRRKRLLLVRDRMGIKPVYYFAGKDFLAFASEIKALFEDPRVPREIDPESVDLYLALRYVPGPKTMFKNIFKLQPGHMLTVENGRVHIRKYWDIPWVSADRPATADLSDSDYIDRFRNLIEESMRLRLIADVPLGVFLSGGLDSSATLALMRRITGRQRIKTFSVGYETSGESVKEASEANELEYAREGAAHFGAEHYEYQVNATEFDAAIPTMVEHLDEPLADPSCIPLYFISRLAREHITVVLSGEGADELFGGYSLYRKIIYLEGLRRRLGPIAAIAPALAMLPVGDRPRNYLRRAGTPLESHYRGVVKGVSPEARLQLTGRDRFWSSERRLDDIFGAYFNSVRNVSTLDRMLYVDAKIWLPENLLLKADKITMATSIELRVPFLDHKLVEFSATLPQSIKIRDGKGKWILREAMGNVLPPSILHRTKKGFPVPLTSWLRFELRDSVRDALLSSDSAVRRYFEPKAIEKIVRRHETGGSDGYQEVWSLMVFEHWHRKFIDSLDRPVESQLQGYFVVKS